MEDDAPRLRELAAHCRQLAKATTTRDVIYTLRELAAEFDAQATKMDSEEIDGEEGGP